MAPTAPRSSKASACASARNKRPSMRARALARLADPTLPRKTHRAGAVVAEGFSDTKRDRKIIRHSALVSRIQKSAASASALSQSRSWSRTRSGGAAAGTKKTRRPSKKLVTTLEALADALPELAEEGKGRGGGGSDAGKNKMKLRSLRSRPGALRRKEKLVRTETARFGANLAQLQQVAASPAAAVGSPGQMEGLEQQAQPQDERSATTAAAATTTTMTQNQNRWATLRTFISATMEQNPAFVNKG